MPITAPRKFRAAWRSASPLARALARTPGVLLLDEPFGALDALTRINMQDLLLDVHRQDPTTILLVTHDVEGGALPLRPGHRAR